MNFQPISTDYRLILASESPRRKSLLHQINLPFRAVPSHVEEKQIKGKPSDQASRLAENKARAVQPEFSNSWILGADTVVVAGEKILGKPHDHDDAESMLYLLRGKEHEVITGFCLLNPGGDVGHAEAITTLVRIKWLTADEIKAYIATGEPFDKAGSYAIQGIGTFMVESISGSYTNVVGLPVCAVVRSLLTAGALKSFPMAQ